MSRKKSPLRYLVGKAEGSAFVYDLPDLAEAAKAVDVERIEKLIALGEAALGVAAAPKWRASMSPADEAARRQAVATYEAALAAAKEHEA